MPFDADDFAYVFVRAGESMLFADLLACREPDVALAETVERALFEAPPSPARRRYT